MSQSEQRGSDDVFEQLMEAGKAVSEAAIGVAATAAAGAAGMVTSAAAEAAKAASSIDFDALGDALAAAVRDVTVALNPNKPEKSPYIVEDKSIAAGGAGKIVGGVLLLAFGTFVAIMALLLIFAKISSALLFGAVAVLLLAAGAVLVQGGLSDRGVARLLPIVSEAVGLRVAVRLDELADQTGTALPRLRQLLGRAIEKGLIPQGRLASPSGAETLFLTDDAYQTQQDASEASRAREARERRQAAKDEQLSADARAAVDACEAFGRALGEAAPSIKSGRTRTLMSELAAKVDAVAARVRRHPELAHDVDRFTSYHLPTAERLVNATAELDREGASGANAAETRAEVDATLSMLSDATTKLLDDLLLDQTWDVSADASVMRTMLQQDGFASTKGSGPKKP